MDADVVSFFRDELKGQALIDIKEGDDVTVAEAFAAELWLLEDGVAWADPGWDTTPTAPFHVLKGEVAMVADREAVVYLEGDQFASVFPAFDFHPLTANAGDWTTYKARKGITRDDALVAARRAYPDLFTDVLV